MKIIQGKTIQGTKNVNGQLVFINPVIVEVADEKVKNSDQELKKLSQIVDVVKEKLWDRVAKTHDSDYHDALLLLEEPTYVNDIKKTIKKSKYSIVSAITLVSNKFIEMYRSITNPEVKKNANLIDLISSLLYNELGLETSQEAEDVANVYLVENLEVTTIERLTRKKVGGVIVSKSGEVKKNLTEMLLVDIPIISLENNQSAFDSLVYKEEVALLPLSGQVKHSFSYVNNGSTTGANLIEQTNTFNDSTIDFSFKISDLNDFQKYFRGLIVETNRLFLTKRPSEIEQVEAYSNIIKKNSNCHIVFELLNVNSNFKPSWLDNYKESISELLVKGIRLSYLDQKLFEEQIRAILIAAKNTKSEIDILLPFITTNEEFFVMKNVIKKIRLDLLNQNSEVGDVQVLVQIQVPALGYGIAEIAKNSHEVILNLDEFAQYLIGVQKDNQLFNHLYQPLNPVVLKFVRYINNQVNGLGGSLTITGEAINNQEVMIALMGLGVKKFAINPHFEKEAQQIANQYNTLETFDVINKVINFKTSNDVLDRINDYIEESKQNH